MLSQVSFPLFAQLAEQQTECPPAGASQEVNEAAPSLAAPSASGQQAGTPLVFEVFHHEKWLATYVCRSPLAAIARCMRDCKRPGVSAYAKALRATDLRAEVRAS